MCCPLVTAVDRVGNHALKAADMRRELALSRDCPLHNCLMKLRDRLEGWGMSSLKISPGLLDTEWAPKDAGGGRTLVVVARELAEAESLRPPAP